MIQIKEFYKILERRRKRNLIKFSKPIKDFYTFVENKNTKKFIINGKNLNLAKYHLQKCYTNQSNNLDTDIHKELITFIYDDVGINFRVASSYIKYIVVSLDTTTKSMKFYIISKRSNSNSLTILEFSNNKYSSFVSDTLDPEFEREIKICMRSMIEMLLVYMESVVIKSELNNYRLEEFLVKIINDLCFNLY
jgi:hypothetical protein